MKRKAIIPLVLGLGIGIVTVKFLVDTIRTAQASNRSADTVTIVRAVEDIDAFEAVTAEKVEVVRTADSLLAPKHDRIADLDGLTDAQTNGRRVAAKAIPAGAAVLKSMLAPEGTPAGLPGRIQPGFRAVSVKIDEVSGVAFQMSPGDWVDVIVVMDIDGSTRGAKETVAEVILQHVQVAAIGHATTTQPTETGSKMKPAKSATLLVREEDVPKLHLAGTRGKLTLAMRGDNPQITGQNASATMSDILGGMRQPGLGQTTPASSTGPRPASFLQALMGGLGGGKPAGPGSANPAPPNSEDPSPALSEAPPYSVLVYRGSAFGGNAPLVEQITFEHAQSSRIIAVADGLPTRAAATMRAQQGADQPRETRLNPPVHRSDNVREQDEFLPDDGE